MRVMETQKGSSILEFIAILPIFSLLLIAFLDLGILLYKQSSLDSAIFGLQMQDVPQDSILFLTSNLQKLGFEPDQLLIEQNDNLLKIIYKHSFLTPLFPKLLQKDYADLKSYFWLLDQRTNM
jgi:hypothetical protein